MSELKATIREVVKEVLEEERQAQANQNLETATSHLGEAVKRLCLEGIRIEVYSPGKGPRMNKRRATILCFGGS